MQRAVVASATTEPVVLAELDSVGIRGPDGAVLLVFAPDNPAR